MGQSRGGVRFDADPIPADGHGEQGARLVLGENVEGHGDGAVTGDQSGQPVPGGDQGETATAAGQQRPNLLRAVRVVQEHEQTPAGEQTAVEAAGLVDLRRDLLGRHPERTEKAARASNGVTGGPSDQPRRLT